jgi:hypothetical protein
METPSEVESFYTKPDGEGGGNPYYNSFNISGNLMLYKPCLVDAYKFVL